MCTAITHPKRSEEEIAGLWEVMAYCTELIAVTEIIGRACDEIKEGFSALRALSDIIGAY